MMMGRATAFRLVLGGYYLALGTWFGAMVMLAISAGATFRTITAYEPTLAASNAIEMTMWEGAEPARVLAGAVVGEAIRGLTVVQVICGAVALLCLILQTTAFRHRLAAGGRSWANGVRWLLVIGALAVLGVNLAWIGPGIWQTREVMYAADTPAEVRAEVEARFQRYHRLSERTTGLAGLLVAAAVLISPFAFRVTAGPAIVERPVRPRPPAMPGSDAGKEKPQRHRGVEKRA